MAGAERRCYADRRLAGAAYTTAGAAAAAFVGLILAGRPEQSSSMRRVTAVATTTYVAVAGRALGEAATAVADALTPGDVPEARRLLPSLVGRDPSRLDGAEIARAAIESVAENTVDAVVAPALWALIGGAPGALAYRAINTLDAMVGHHSPRYERFGWASARADDLAGWIPARVTAALVALARPAAMPAIREAVRRQAPAHPSPNAGVTEAAFAAALGLRLGGTNRYGERVEHRPTLGTGRAATAADIARAVRLSRDVTLLLSGAIAATSLAGRRRSS
jgi:adenosylcobinamide-phosphate synthase